MGSTVYLSWWWLHENMEVNFYHPILWRSHTHLCERPLNVTPFKAYWPSLEALWLQATCCYIFPFQTENLAEYSHSNFTDFRTHSKCCFKEKPCFQLIIDSSTKHSVGYVPPPELHQIELPEIIDCHMCQLWCGEVVLWADSHGSRKGWACTVFFQKRADATGSLLLNKHAEVKWLTLCDNTDTNPVIFHLMNIAYWGLTSLTS